jgi:predicted RNase H-like HicB family nuclease
VTTKLHVIVRDEDGAWGGWSPNAPGFFIAASSAEELRDQLSDAVRYWASQTLPAEERTTVTVEVHVEERTQEKFVTRVAQDELLQERVEVRNRVHRALTVPEQADLLATQTPENVSGERLIVAVAPSDTLAWLGEQMPPGEHLIAAAAAADDLFISFHVTKGGAGGRPVQPGSRGNDTTVADVVGNLDIRSAGLASIKV